MPRSRGPEKIRANLYFDKEIFERSRVAVEALGSHVSEYLEDYMRENLEMLETAAATKDPARVAEVFKSNFFDIFVREMNKNAEFMRTIQQEAKGVKAEKPKAKISKK